MIELDEQFDVPGSAAAVWRLLSDPYRVVGCVPGATLGKQHEDGAFDAALAVKFGPLSVQFQAQVELHLDHAAMSGRLTARARDKQGGARVQAGMRFAVTQEQDGASVSMTGEVDISGKLAALIESGAANVVQSMSRDFATCLSERLGARKDDL
jgi:carbon monoxide dehydrogenase subunit G